MPANSAADTDKSVESLASQCHAGERLSPLAAQTPARPTQYRAYSGWQPTD